MIKQLVLIKCSVHAKAHSDALKKSPLFGKLTFTKECLSAGSAGVCLRAVAGGGFFTHQLTHQRWSVEPEAADPWSSALLGDASGRRMVLAHSWVVSLSPSPEE